MSRSRNHLIRSCVLVAAVVGTLAFPALAHADQAASVTPPWVHRISYLVDTAGVSDKLFAAAGLDAAQRSVVIAEVARLDQAYQQLQLESDAVVQRHDLSLGEKQAAVAAMRYNERLSAAEDECYAGLNERLGQSALAMLGQAAAQTWETDRVERDCQNASETVNAMSIQVLAGYVPAPYTVFATQYGINTSTPVPQVALPDEYAKFANYQNSSRSGYPNSKIKPSQYAIGDYAVRITLPDTGKTTVAGVWDCGPWNIDDNYWNPNDGVRPRRLFRDLAMGKPESVAAYRDGYNGGKDQFGRKVTQEAAIDLGVDAPESGPTAWQMRSPWEKSVPYALGLRLRQNAYVQITPLWESQLDLVASPQISYTPGPYLTGQRVTFTYTVKNSGTLAGTWDSFRFLVRRPNGSFDYGPQSGPVTLGPGATRTFSFTHTLDSAGTLSGCPDALRAGTWSGVGSASVTMSVASRTVDRLGGATRFETAVALSKAAYPGTAPAVVIATGFNFPDALAGAALAHAEDGPMLLVGPTLSPSVEAEVKRLSPSKIFILGSTAVVPADVASKLADDVPGATVTRLGGWNRYATSRLIAQQVVTQYGGKAPNGTVIVATGRDFPDALAASVLSADKGWPIVLTDAASVTTDTAAALTAVGATNSYVIGGNTVVYPSVLQSLPSPTRIAGAERYETSALVADLAESKGLTYKYVGLALGSTYPDALTGGVLAAHGWGTMLLTPKAGLTSAVQNRLAGHRTVTTHLQAYGSIDALPAATLKQAEDALR